MLLIDSLCKDKRKLKTHKQFQCTIVLLLILIHYLNVMDKKEEREEKKWRQYFNLMMNTRTARMVLVVGRVSKVGEEGGKVLYIRPHASFPTRTSIFVTEYSAYLINTSLECTYFLSNEI